MAKTNKHKAQELARKNFEKEVAILANKARNEIITVLNRYSNRAFNLAVKHSQTISAIQEEIVEAKKK